MDQSYYTGQINQVKYQISQQAEALSQYERELRKLSDAHQKVRTLKKRFNDSQERGSKRLQSVLTVNHNKKLTEGIYRDLRAQYFGQASVGVLDKLAAADAKISALICQTDDKIAQTRSTIAELENRLCRLNAEMSAAKANEDKA